MSMHFRYDDLDLPPPEDLQLPERTLAAQQELIAQGEVSQHIYWLHEGLIRAVFTDLQGRSYTKEFFWQGDVVMLVRSLLTREPLPYSLIALENCRYSQLPLTDYRQRIAQDPAWQQYHQRLLEVHLINKERKEEFLLLNTPEQRVVSFHQLFPWLIVRVPDYVLASYLGMTPISYSRIKKRLNNC